MFWPSPGLAGVDGIIQRKGPALSPVTATRFFSFLQTFLSPRRASVLSGTMKKVFFAAVVLFTPVETYAQPAIPCDPRGVGGEGMTTDTPEWGGGDAGSPLFPNGITSRQALL